ncbi:MAG TPA: hypothetical protein VIG08_05475 [Gemmatimonadales bacterium]|jgi:hypothetical protein
MTAPATEQALRRLASPLRLVAGAGWITLALGAAAFVLGVAAWLVRLGLVEAPWWVLAAWSVAGAGLGTICWLAWRDRSRLSSGGVAAALEKTGSWRRGSLTSLLDQAAAGTSIALLALADRAQAADLGSRGGEAVAPLSHAVRLLGMAGVATLVTGLVAFVSAGPARGVAAALWHPARAWEATLAPVQIRAASALVNRGDSVDLMVQAIGRRAATLWIRVPGEVWRARGVRLDSTGRATVSSGALRSDVFARVTSGSRSSDTVLVRVRLPVFLGSVAVTAHYPSYLGLDAEPVPTGGDTLLLPAGTRLDTRGQATAPLARAVWSDGRQTEALTVTGGRFGGSFVPARSGEFRLVMATANGSPLAGDTVRLPVRLVADSAPRVDVPIPGADTIAPLDLLVPLVVDVRDDHGITSVVLESRRIGRLSGPDSARRETVPLPPDITDRAILSPTLDLNRRGLLPGDTLKYFAIATDNTPGRQVGRSREFVLRLPTMSEVRAAQRVASESVGQQLDSVAEASKRLERETDDLGRGRVRSGDGRGEKSAESLTFEESKKAEAVAESQQQLIRQAEDLQRSIEALRKSAEAAGLADSAWQRELSEIREQIDRALTPELRERLAALQQALKDLDAGRAKDALERLAEAQKELREALERSRELFRRAAVEGDLANLGKESRELAQEQRQWNSRIASADSAKAAAEERDLAARADSLAAAVGRLSKGMEEEDRRARLDSTAGGARKAGSEMKGAASSSQRGQRSEAGRQGEQAAQSLDPLSDRLQQERAGLQQAWRQEVTGALDQALAETSRLAERQLAVQEALEAGTEPGSTVRAEQSSIEEGVQRLVEQMRKVSGKNALVPSGIGTALGGAQQQMQRAREAISNAAPNTREGAEEAGGAVDALNAAAYQLLQARGDVSGAASGSGLAEAIERMNQLAQQQGGLGRQSAGLLPMAGNGAIREELQRLGNRQRALAEEMQRLRAQGNMPGAAELADEAKDLARKLESGRLDRQLVERQERLFRRMLDAGRTLQGREEDERKERRSTTATDDSVHLPPALRARLTSEDDRLRVPSWEELQRFSPEERRLVVDYFRRLSEGGGR